MYSKIYAEMNHLNRKRVWRASHTWVMFGEKTIAIFLAFILLYSSSSTTSAMRSIAQLSKAASVGFSCFTSSTEASSVLHWRTCSGERPSSTPEGSSLNHALISPAKQCTSMSSGTIPLFNWSLTCSSWLFSGFIRNIPSRWKIKKIKNKDESWICSWMLALGYYKYIAILVPLVLPVNINVPASATE